jgi:hypothetical protein
MRVGGPYPLSDVDRRMHAMMEERRAARAAAPPYQLGKAIPATPRRRIGPSGSGRPRPPHHSSNRNTASARPPRAAAAAAPPRPLRHLGGAKKTRAEEYVTESDSENEEEEGVGKIKRADDATSDSEDEEEKGGGLPSNDSNGKGGYTTESDDDDASATESDEEEEDERPLRSPPSAHGGPPSLDYLGVARHAARVLLLCERAGDGSPAATGRYLGQGTNSAGALVPFGERALAEVLSSTYAESLLLRGDRTSAAQSLLPLTTAPILPLHDVVFWKDWHKDGARGALHRACAPYADFSRREPLPSRIAEGVWSKVFRSGPKERENLLKRRARWGKAFAVRFASRFIQELLEKGRMNEFFPADCDPRSAVRATAHAVFLIFHLNAPPLLPCAGAS